MNCKKEKMLKKIAYALANECENGCPCKNGCNAIMQIECIDKIMEWLKQVIKYKKKHDDNFDWLIEL